MRFLHNEIGVKGQNPLWFCPFSCLNDVYLGTFLSMTKGESFFRLKSVMGNYTFLVVWNHMTVLGKKCKSHATTYRRNCFFVL